MKLRIQARIQNYRAYWKGLKALDGASLFLAKVRYLHQNDREKEREAFSAVKVITAATIREFVGVTGAILTIAAIDLFFLAPIYQPYVTLNADFYLQLMLAIAAIGGIFIALFYSALAAVMAAVYSKIDSDLRNLLSQESKGQTYMRLLGYTTYATVLLAAFSVFGVDPIATAIIIAVFLGGFGILAFGWLGSAAFRFLNPTALLDSTTFAFVKSVNRVAAAGAFSGNDVLEYNSRLQAEVSLGAISTIIKTALEKPGTNLDSLISSASSIVRLGDWYLWVRRSIRPSSRWYNTRFVHPAWYQSDDSSVLTFGAAGTILQPKEVKDARWVERTLEQCLLEALHGALKANNLSAAQAIFSKLNEYLEILAFQSIVPDAFALWEKASDLVVSHIEYLADGELVEEESAELVRLVESVGSGSIYILLGWRRYLLQHNAQGLRDIVCSMDWGSETRSYKKKLLPIHLLDRVAWFYKVLGFERSVHGRRKTPDWYILELIFQIEVSQIKKSIDVFSNDMPQQFDRNIARLIGCNRPWLSAVLLGKLSEYFAKCRAHRHVAFNAHEDLSQDRRATGLPWEALNVETLRDNWIARRREHDLRVSTFAALLSSYNRKDDQPDYAGMFLHATGNSIVTGLDRRDADAISQLFPNYFRASFNQWNKLFPNGQVNARTEGQFRVALAPVIDLLEVSGLVLITAAALEMPHLYRPVEEAWDQYLDAPEGEQRLRWLATVLASTRLPLTIPHRETIRDSWRTVLNDVFRELPAARRQRHSRWVARTIRHDNPLVRVVANSGVSWFSSGYAIFACGYLLTRSGARDIQWGRAVEELNAQVAREGRDREER